MPRNSNYPALRNTKPTWLRWLVLCSLFIIQPALAQVLIVTSGEQITYQKVASAITHQIAEPFTLITMDELAPIHGNAKTYPTVVTIGSQASDQAFTHLSPEQTLIMAFLPKRTYLGLLEKHTPHPRQKLKNFTAVFLDQPLERQFNLIRIIKPDTATLATALGAYSQQELPELERLGAAQGIKIKQAILSENDNPMQKLQPLIAGSDVVLTLPDKSLFNRTTAKWILYISFRQGIPLFGFSEKYVKAGAIAAVYSKPNDIGRQTAEVLSQWLNQKRLADAQYPSYFNVVTNPVAARSLRINIKSPEIIQQQLKGMEP